ncbi:hypothetical protein G3N59_31345 [Paraburkholderia sp. Ac-20340]|uniref:retroviral-like aspartic protease family protein n=1 Tax=Paraburkholderia sp. Ac-20340 TaxID=2703888 RepID=UPI00197D4CB7|nr:retroviral-like aspartic protease family protein [Paraburkholderia sp. Ac-20340]MBN3857888.1 hypothetical protein [Paraburkholderia sp. Ac-20340]
MTISVRLIAALGAMSATGFTSFAFAQQTNTSSANTCELHADATLPLIESNGHYLVNVELNGIERPLYVDTSAEKTALTPEAADALNLPYDTSTEETINGLGSQAAPLNPRVLASLKLGTAQWSDLQVPGIGVHAFVARNGVQPAGVLGANVLSRYDVELDFPHRTMTLYSAQNCLGRFAPWQGEYDSYSPIYTRTHRFVMQMALNHRPILAILDTGAVPSLVSPNGAMHVGLDPTALAQDPLRTGFGINNTALSAYVHRFDTVQIGSRQYQNVDFQVSNTSFPTDMLLGMDFLKWRRVWLSYSTGWVFMQLETPQLAARTLHYPEPADWANSSGTEHDTAIINQDGEPKPGPIAQFSSHSHMTYRSYPTIVQQSRLQPPPNGMVPLNSPLAHMGP